MKSAAVATVLMLALVAAEIPEMAEAAVYNEHSVSLDVAPIARDKGAWQSSVVLRGSLDGGSKVVFFRRDGLTFRAWRKKQREDFFDKVEAGVASLRDGYRRISRKSGRIDSIPYLDLAFAYRGDKRRRRGRLRILFFRRYAMLLSVDSRRSRDKAEIRRLFDSFVPTPAEETQ